MSDNLSDTTVSGKKEKASTPKLDAVPVVDPTVDLASVRDHDAEHDAGHDAGLFREDHKPSVEDRLAGAEELVQRLVNFFHWMFPDHGVPGVPDVPGKPDADLGSPRDPTKSGSV